jgi:hypothetical protein
MSKFTEVSIESLNDVLAHAPAAAFLTARA